MKKHKDWSGLKRALREIRRINEQINERKGIQDSLTMIQKIQSSLVGYDLLEAENRIFVHEGVWTQIRSDSFLIFDNQDYSNNKSVKDSKKQFEIFSVNGNQGKKNGKKNRAIIKSKGEEYYIFLFSDAILKTVKRGDHCFLFVSMVSLKLLSEISFKKVFWYTSQGGEKIYVATLVWKTDQRLKFVLGSSDEMSERWRSKIEEVLSEQKLKQSLIETKAGSEDDLRTKWGDVDVQLNNNNNSSPRGKKAEEEIGNGNREKAKSG